MSRALVFGYTLALLCVHVLAQTEYAPYNGWRNNIQRPSWGAQDTNFLRKLPNSYSDHTYELITTRPNARNISNAVMNGMSGLGSYLNRTTMLVFFGYQIALEVLDGQSPGCPVEYINIPATCDSLYDPQCGGTAHIPLVRGRYDRTTGQKPGGSRQMLNRVTPWIDGSSIYGSTKFWSDNLRTFQGGLLATDPADARFPDFNNIGLPFPNPPAPRDYKLKPVQRLFKVGNERADENPMLLSLSILWLKNHNYYANQIATQNPTWTDDQIYNKARQYNVAVLQHLVLERWLPAWLNQTIPPYQGYNANIDPDISLEFAAAAMRWGHTLVPPGQYRRSSSCVFQNTTTATVYPGYIALRTCNTYFNAQEAVLESGIEPILMGMASQIAEREDNIIVEDLRQYVHGPLEQVRRDLMAINIQRGRDYGLPDYNTARVYYGMQPNDFNQITADQNLAATLANVYNNDMNNIDIWTGGLLESGPQGPGPLFSAIILDQFLRLRDGDRFWYNNTLNGLFTLAEIAMIQETELSTVINQATNLPPGSIQLDVFHHNAGDVCPQPKQLTTADMEVCTPPKTYDYFSISTVEYPFISISAAIFLVMVAALMILLVRYKSSFYPKEKTMSFQIPADQDMEGTMVFGALSLNKNLDVLQTVTIRVDKTGGNLVIMSANGKIAREVALKKLEKVESSVKDADLLMIKVPREYDLFFKFATQLSKDRFYDHLLKGRAGLAMEVMNTSQLIKTMKTKEARKAEIQQFFGKLIERVFNNKGNPASGLRKDQSFRESDVHGLSLDEFAEIFELPRNSLFVAQLFKYANKNQDGNITPQEFFQLLALFSRKSPKDKIKFMFEIYDVDGTGRVSREHFTAMFMSTLEMNNQGASKSNIEEVIESMYRKAGLKGDEEITFEAFKLMVGDYSDLFQLANLGGKNAKPLQRGGTRIYGDQTKDPKKQLKRGQSVTVKDKPPQELTTIERFQRYVFDRRLEIFWLGLFYLGLLGVATERIYSYSFERETRGLRRIAGYGISTTRGAASGMMYSFAILLLSLCRNLMAILRNTFLRKFIPFDAADDFHILAGITSFVVVAIHVTGHLINFFSIATEPTYSLACLFREVTWPSDYLPAFSWWVFKTPTGVSGFVVTYICIIMGVFSVKYFRTHFFVVFKIIHQSCAFMIYCLMLMHGWAQLVQVAIFHTYLIGPLFLYSCDLLISIYKRAELMEVTKTEWLPSDVLMIQFEKPKGLDYKAGQWLRIASAGISRVTFHPFTITSAPHEKFLSLHIRAVGPWTRKMREIYNPRFEKHPPVVIDGPFGAATDGWHSFSHVIFVGAGIGVTPFASILKNFVYMAKNNAEFEVKKVIFFWICRSQRQFEWLVDIIREAEAQDVGHRLEVHIFVTELNQKFDLRTIMLYIAEKQFYKLNGASLFTGLQASTHFGRPDFEDLFKQIQINVKADLFAVFSCAPSNMVNDIQDACDSVSRRAGTQFRHFDDSFV